MHLRTLGPVMLVMLGCQRCNPDDEEQPATLELDASAPASVELGSATGVGTVFAPVRLVNAYGVAVAPESGSVTVALGGSELDATSATVSLDQFGYGEVAVSSELGQEVLLTVTDSSDGASTGGTAPAWITEEAPPELGMFSGWPSEMNPEHMVAVEGGLILAVESRVFWQGGDRFKPAQQVAHMPSEVLGVAAGRVDDDLVPDLLIWTADEVALLRGRSGGGFSWGIGFEVPEREIRSAALGDVNGDNLLDLVIAYGSGSTGGFQLLEGDGVWGFTGGLPYELDAEIWSVAVGYFGADATSDIALLVRDDNYGVIRRYGRTAEAWYVHGEDLAGANVSNAEPLTQGSYFMPATDLNGDQSDELIAMGAPSSDSMRSLIFYNFADGVTQYGMEFQGYQAALGDVTGDAITDIVLTESDPQQLRVITSEVGDADSTFVNDAVGAVPTGGPVGVGEFTGDGVDDILITSEVISLYTGEINDKSRWSIATDGFITFGVNAVGSILVEDLGGDGWPEVISVREGGGGVSLQVYNMYLDGDVVRMASPTENRLDVDSTSSTALAEGLDMERCGDTLYLLTDDAGPHLWAMGISETGALSAVKEISVSGVDRLACGEMADGATVVVAGQGGNWDSFDRDLNPVDGGNLSEAIGDLTIADTDGGGGALFTCSGAACSMASADLDGDGLDEVIQGGQNTRAQGWDLDFEFGQPGEVSILDFDGDGRLDVAFTDQDQERVAIYRSLHQAFAPALIYHGLRDLEGPAMLADGDGDGVPELFFQNADGNLLRSKGSNTDLN